MSGDNVADGTRTIIPNDNLMSRDSKIIGNQSLQEAKLLKVRIGYCHELIVAFVNSSLRAMLSYDPRMAPAIDSSYCRWWIDDGSPPDFFSPLVMHSFADNCIRHLAHNDRRSIVLYVQSIMRMKTFAVLKSPP